MPLPFAAYAIPLIAGVVGKMFGKKAPRYGIGDEEIDELINTYRQAGMNGLESLARQEKGGAVSRLAASGMEPTLAMQQALFAPIIERLASARTGLEGSLAQTEAGMREHSADMDFGGQMAQWQDMENLWASLMDIGGMGIGSQFFNQGQGDGGGGSQPQQIPAYQGFSPQQTNQRIPFQAPQFDELRSLINRYRPADMQLPRRGG